ncbi:MAG: DUF370 domain-containing protein [Oscillospiraceae bacterium]|nr:DUF370 domain-containing protein [Oscillospiraceae bacterium]
MSSRKDIHLLNIGFGNLVTAERILAVVSPDSAPVKRIVQEEKERGRVIDASFGRRTRAVLIMDSGHVVLSALTPETLSARLNGRSEDSEEEEKDE